MAATMQELGIDQWTVEERLALAEAIWTSIEREMEQEPLTEAESRLIEERLAAYEADPSRVVPWEAVRERLLTRLQR